MPKKKIVVTLLVFMAWVALASYYLLKTTFVEDDDVDFIIHDTAAAFTNSIGMEFVYINPGKFFRGNKFNKNKVYITNGFYLQKTEVTQGQWKRVMESNPSYFKECGNSCPVEMVSKKNVGLFIEKLLKMEPHLIYRLPTEAEWEYSAIVGNNIEFENDKQFNRQLDRYGWFSKNSEKSTHPVATKTPNKQGVFDMHGNVFEWCLDKFYHLKPTDKINPYTFKSDKSGNHVVKGGSWRTYFYYCKSAVRSQRLPYARFSDVGFRLVIQLQGD